MKTFSPQRFHERFFETAISAILGVPVEHIDDGSANGMVDALIRFPDGMDAALEVTTVADEAVMQMESFDIHLDVPESRYWWDVRYPGKVLNQKLLRRLLPALIRRLDSLDLNDATQLDSSVRASPDLIWYEASGILIRRIGLRQEGGRAAVLPEATGGAVDEHLESLRDWIEENQSADWWTTNVDKLVASGYPRRHLAVMLHGSGIPFSLASGFWDASEITSPPPTNMAPLTELWLFASYGRYLARWSESVGWQSYAVEATWTR